jgi:magnesium transporter
MLSAYLFDQRKGESVEAWADALQSLTGSQVLWLDLLDVSAAEELEVKDALGLEDLDICGDGRQQPALTQRADYLEVTAVCVVETEDRSPAQPATINCFVGKNWVVTSHAIELAIIDEFRARTEGQGDIGDLDAPTFLAALLGSVVTSYQRAFDRIEMDLEEFDLEALRSARRDTEQRIGVLVDVRQQVGALRRSLVPHREVFVALSEREFDPVSTEQSANRFIALAVKTDAALTAALDAKNAITGSFDVVIARTEHRTNEIMKVLALASILLLPGALIAGVMGMNVNFSASVFTHSPTFWAVMVLIALLAVGTLGAARVKHWI